MQVAILALSIAVFGSLWMPWIQIPQPFGNSSASLVPWDILESMFDPPQGRNSASLSDMSPLLLAFLSAFPVAAVVAVKTMFGAAPRGLLVIAGAIPFAVIIWLVVSTAHELERSGVPARNLFDGARMLGVDARDMEQFLAELAKILGPGAYFHYLGAFGLFVIGMRSPEKKEFTPSVK
jgi:hypothetical protein